MEKKFNIVVGEDGTVKLPDAVLEKLEVKPGEEVRFEVDDNFYAVRLLSRIEAERLDYLNWMHNKHCPSIEEMIAESRKQATQNIVISRILFLFFASCCQFRFLLSIRICNSGLLAQPTLLSQTAKKL